MKHYYLHLKNPKFYIADQTVNAMIKMLKRIDPQIKISRGKENGWAIYFDSYIDRNTFERAIKGLITKYDYLEYQLMLLKNSKVGISESKSLNNLLSFNDLFEIKTESDAN